MMILFDGDCNFCDASVQFIMKRDHTAVFTFASLQSETGQRQLAAHRLPPNLDSIVLIVGDRAYVKSTAVLLIARQLTGLWKLSFGFILIPRVLRDLCYQLIAKNRYNWFGKKTSCLLPTPEERQRFFH